MASQADSAATKSYEISIIEVVGLPRLRLALSVKAHIQVDAGSVKWRTQEVKWKKGGGIKWDEKTILPPSAPSEKITISLNRGHRIDFLHKSSNVSQGSVEMELAELLHLQASSRRPNEDVVLALQYKGKSTCKLAVRITESATTALSSTIDQLESFPDKLPAPGLTAVREAMSAAGDGLTSLAQSDLVGSFETLVDKMGVLVKIGDEIAKIHPWVNLAWSVLSVGLKLVKAQQDRDNKITALIQTMQSTYSIIIGSEILQDERLQVILDRILKQTVICGFFIQGYTRGRTFAGKAITETFSSTDGMVSQYKATFKQLREEYMGRIVTQTAVVTFKTASTVDAIRFAQVINQLRPAVMDESKRDVCLTDTRLDAIKSITSWFSSESEGQGIGSAMWVHGVAGAGKSTLSTTAARMTRDLDLLGAFFFFNRDLPESNASTLIRTLAYQLARFDPIIGAKIQQIVEKTPNIADMTLTVQFSTLLSVTALGDVPWCRGPVLVVIDALDEAGSAQERADLIRVLSEGVSKLPWFLRILILSRRERDILDGFQPTAMQQEELRVDSQTSQADVTVFIRARLNDTRARNIAYLRKALQDWPSGDEVDALATLAGGHFIWAQTACRLIDESHNPKKRMTDLINDQSLFVSSDSFASLHLLYKTALQTTRQWADPSFCRDFRDILGVVCCAQEPLSCAAIDSLIVPRVPLQEDCLPSLQTVSLFGSLLHWSNAGPTRILHGSFYDYLTVHARAEPWAIDVQECNVQLAKGCIKLLEQELRANMCNLTLPQPVLDESLSEPVAYASRFWIEHVCLITDASEDLAVVVYQFMHKHVLHWIEALTIMKAFDVVMRLLPKLLKWIQIHFSGSELYHFVHDAHRFSQYFANTIIEHPLLVYASAVPFTPHNTIVYTTFHNTKLPHVVSGIQPTWPPLLQVLLGHERPVSSAAFSPNGTQIVSGSGDKTVRVWDAVTGQAALPPLEGHEDGVWSVAFSPDGAQIVSGSDDKTVRMWDAVTGQAALAPLEGHKDRVASVAFSPDGTQIVSGSRDRTVRVWDAVTGQAALPPLEGHEDGIWSVAFSPDGTHIVSGSYDKTVRVWDAVTGQATLPPLEGHENGVYSAAFSPDGTQIVSGSGDKTVRVWYAATGQAAFPPLEGHEDMVRSVAFSPDGTQIVSGSVDKTVRVWDAVTGQAAFPPLEGHESSVRSVAFSPDGTQIVSGSRDKTVRVWDAVTGHAVLPPLAGHEPVLSIALSPDGTQIASGLCDYSVRVWDAVTGETTLPPLEGHEDSVRSVAFSSDGTQIVSGSVDKTVRVWDAVTGQAALPPLEGHEGSVLSVAFSPDGIQIVSGSRDQTVRVWNAATGQAVLPPLAGHEDPVTSVAFSPDGTQIVSGSGDKTVRVWDAVTGKLHNGGYGDTIIPRHQSHDKAQISLSLNKQDYFIDVHSGHHLGKIPVGFAFRKATCHGSRCVVWRQVSLHLWVPVVIHFPPV